MVLSDDPSSEAPWTRCTCLGTANQESAFYKSFKAFAISDTGITADSTANLNQNWRFRKGCLIQGSGKKTGKRAEPRVTESH